MRKVIPVILLALVAIGGVVYALHIRFSSPVRQFPQSRSMKDVQQRLGDLAGLCPNMRVSSLGPLSYGSETLAMPVLHFTPSGEIRHRVLLTGCVHGNEPAGAKFLLEFCETLRAQPDKYPGVAFDIIPLVNPWGWEHNSRENGAGTDLNRDFNSFKAGESVLMREHFQKNKYDLAVDFHEDGGAQGFYYYRLDNADDPLCKEIIAKEKAGGHSIHDGTVMTIFTARDGIINCEHWSLALARVARQLSMSNYFRLEGCPRVFLFETPARRQMEERIAMDRTGLDVLLTKLCEKGQ
jgi:hypothetical protein